MFVVVERETGLGRYREPLADGLSAPRAPCPFLGFCAARHILAAAVLVTLTMIGVRLSPSPTPGWPLTRSRARTDALAAANARPYRRSSARLSRPLDCSGPGARSGVVCRPRSACSASF